MLDNVQTKEIYSKIQRQLFYMIPEKWNKIYLYASVNEKINHLETGELFFYYFPKGILRKNPTNSYEIPTKFNLEEESYMKLMDDLYELIRSLRECFRKAGEELWTNLTIKIEVPRFTIDFHYDKWEKEEDQRLIWTYQNLNIPLESYPKKQRQLILQYLQEQKLNPSKVQTYTEPMYERPIKNVVQYNHETSKQVVQKHLGKRFYHAHKNSKTLKASKVKLKQPIVESKVSIEEQIEKQIKQQREAIKSQILNYH